MIFRSIILLAILVWGWSIAAQSTLLAANTPSAELADSLRDKAFSFFDVYQSDSGLVYLEAASAMYLSLESFDEMLACETERMRQVAFKGNFSAAWDILSSSAAKLRENGQDTLNVAFGRMHRQASAIASLDGNEMELRVCRRVFNFAHALNGPKGYLFAVSCDNFAPAYFKLDKLDSALYVIDLGIAAAEELEGKHFKEKARLYNRKGYLLYNFGDMLSSIEVHKKAIDVMLDSLDASNPEMAVFYNQIAFSYYKLGDYPKATFYHNLALEVVQNASQQMTHQWASALKGLGFVALAKGDYEGAIDYMRQTRVKFLEVFKRKDHMFLREPMVVTGRSFNRMGQYDSAMYYFERALANGHYSFSWDSIMIYTYIANTHFQLGEFEVGLELNDFVIEQFNKKKLQHHFLYGYEYALRARFLARLNRFEEANKALATAYEALNYEPGSMDFSGLYSYNELVTLLSYNAEIFLLNHKLSETEKYSRAVAVLDEAAELITQSRSIKSRDPLNYETVSQNNEVFSQLIEYNAKLFQLTGDENYQEQSFYNSERYRANLLLEIARDLEAKEVAGIPVEQQNRERELRLEISTRESKLKDMRKQLNQVERADVSAEIFTLKQAHESLVKELETDFPDYFNLKYNDKTSSISELRGMLDSTNRVLLEYYMSDSLLYVFVLSTEEFTTITKPLPADFKDKLDSYIGMLHELDVDKRPDFSTYSMLSHYLHKILVGPVSNLIEGRDLIILPDDKLYYLPFETLLSKAEGSYINAPYLLRKHAISYYYSATLLGASSDRKKASTRDYLGMAPAFDPDLDSTLPIAVRSGLTSLDGAQREVKTISGFLGGRGLSGAEASEHNFKKFGGDYNVLHLATHAIKNDEHPLNAYLIFSQDEQGLEDGQLHLYELYNMQLDAELAALSACFTGYGEILRGEGVISFAHAFSYANCPNILMSLWAAEDKATAEIVSETFRHLKAGKEKDKALQLAKLSYLESADPLRANPFYWSAMVLMGESSPIDFSAKASRGLSSTLIGGILGGLFSIVFIFWLIRRRQDRLA